MHDGPATRRCPIPQHRDGMRIHVITGDYGLTAAESARQVGIGHEGGRITTGTDLERLTDPQLDAVLAGTEEIIFARTSRGETAHLRGPARAGAGR